MGKVDHHSYFRRAVNHTDITHSKMYIHDTMTLANVTSFALVPVLAEVNNHSPRTDCTDSFSLKFGQRGSS